MTLSELAPAKINLCLHVTGQRADGYHLLDSIVVFADIGDLVSAQPHKGLSLSITGPEGEGLSAGADNLVLRAARLMGAQDLALTLDKHLPVASGIGGGSSDAAACLRLLAHVQGAALPAPEHVLRLGADVPVCLRQQSCRMRGIGEDIAPLPALPALWMVLVNPRQQVPTPRVFQQLQHRENPPLSDTLPSWPDAAALCRWLSDQRNDLEAPALAVLPVIGEVLAALRATDCALARMSGSGATCFALYPDAFSAQRAALRIKTACPDWWCVATAVRQ